MDERRLRTPGVAFLLSQLGGLAQREWTARVARLGLEPREVMLFRFVALADGHSQREVARAIGLPASRVVALVDRLETRGWVERRRASADRRTRTLHVTPAGRAILAEVMTTSAAFEADMTIGLDDAERTRLIELLTRIATAQGLTAGVHPGFADPRADQAGHGGAPPSAARGTPRPPSRTRRRTADDDSG
jgi:DNA-binding MarR family transcriptional regulator